MRPPIFRRSASRKVPTQWAHRFYWAISDTAVAPVVVSKGGYPGWQASVVTPSLFGAISAWWDVQYARIRWWIAFAPRIHRLNRERRAVLLRTLDLLESPAYPAARKAVRQTAVTLGFASPASWVEYSRALKASPGRAENLFRHVRATELTKTYLGSTLTNPTVHFVTELAYQAYALKPWTTD